MKIITRSFFTNVFRVYFLHIIDACNYVFSHSFFKDNKISDKSYSVDLFRFHQYTCHLFSPFVQSLSVGFYFSPFFHGTTSSILIGFTLIKLELINFTFNCTCTLITRRQFQICNLITIICDIKCFHFSRNVFFFFSEFKFREENILKGISSCCQKYSQKSALISNKIFKP